MSARVLPDVEDLEIDPAAAEVLEEAKRELTGRLPDSNEATLGRPIESENELDQLNAREVEREARRQAKQAEAREPDEASSPTAQPASIPVDQGKRSAPIDFRAELEKARHELDLLASLPRPHELQPQHASSASDASDDEVEFFRNPREAVAKAVANHPAMAALKGAVRETYQRKTAAQFAKEHPDAEQVIQDSAFRAWASSSPIRMQLLKTAHENYDLEAAREVFGTWKALRGAPAQAASKAKVYRRSEIQKLMIDRPDEYERRADEFARAYAAGRVR